MKKLLMLTAGLVAASANTAYAADTTATYDVKASVAEFCTTLNNSSTALDFGALTVDGAGKLTGTWTKTGTQANVTCNGSNTTIKVETLPMTNAATVHDTTNFTNQINYTTTVSLAGHSVLVDGAAHAIGELTGTLSVTADTLAPVGGKALIAGNYAGTVKVTLAPAI